jgi:hypothetical protein
VKFSPELIERAVRVALEHRGEHQSQWAAIGHFRLLGRDAARVGSSARARHGAARGLSTAERQRIKALDCEVRGLRQGRREPAQGKRVPRIAYLPRRSSTAALSRKGLHRSIDEHGSAYGVEPACKVMQIAPSTYWRRRRAGRRHRTRVERQHPPRQAARRGRHRNPRWAGGQRRRQLRQRAGRDDQRPLQAEVIHRRAPWKTKEGVETRHPWVGWSTAIDCSSPSATRRTPRLRRPTIVNSPDQP